MHLKVKSKYEYDDQLLTIDLIGQLSSVTVEQFDQALTENKLTSVRFIVLNLKGLDYISSAGFRAIFQITKLMQARGGEVKVANRQPQVKKVFEIIQALPTMQFFADDVEMDAYLTKIQTELQSSHSLSTHDVI
ncbi:MAG: STAS domain-containing protein [Cellvibrionales bacterium]|nr:STAS domain-containing protein [Cellvibrionales bacterium]